MIISIKSLTILLLTIFIFSSGINILAQSRIKSITIYKQVWMVDNLNVDRFKNGDLIPEGKTKEEWVTAGKEKKPAWYYYNNDPVNGKKYGKLYNWYAVNDKRGLAPQGWHIPTSAEFQILFNAVDNDGNAMKAKGEGTGSGVGTNKSGLTILLAGYRDKDGEFYDVGEYTYIWSSTMKKNGIVFKMSLINNGSGIFFDEDSEDYGFSVRCIKD